MPKKKQKEGFDFGYDGLSQTELKDTVIRLWKEIKALEAEKKDYVKSISDSVKELKERIDNVVYWIGVKQTEKDKKRLVESVGKAVEPGE